MINLDDPEYSYKEMRIKMEGEIGSISFSDQYLYIFYSNSYEIYDILNFSLLLKREDLERIKDTRVLGSYIFLVYDNNLCEFY